MEGWIMVGMQLHSPDWSIRRTPSHGTGRRSAAALPDFPFLTSETSIADSFVAEPRAMGRRGPALAGPLDFSYTLAQGDAAVLALRQQSGDHTINLTIETHRRGARKRNDERFTV
jgi:hypothetical protein